MFPAITLSHTQELAFHCYLNSTVSLTFKEFIGFLYRMEDYKKLIIKTLTFKEFIGFLYPF